MNISEKSIVCAEPLKIHSAGKISSHNLLIYVKRGIVDVRTGTNTYSLSPGKGIIIPQKREFCFKGETASVQGFILFFEACDEIPIALTLQTGPRSPLRLAANKLSAALYAGEGWEAYGRKALDCALTALNDSVKKPHTVKYNSPALMAKGFMDENYNRDITAGDAADFCGISESFLNSCFVPKFGIAPKQYILLKRISAAKELLETTALSSGEVGSAVGFTSPQRFNDIFRKKVGMPPLEYRAVSRYNSHSTRPK